MNVPSINNIELPILGAKEYKSKSMLLYYTKENMNSIRIHQKALESEGWVWNREDSEIDDDGNFLRVYNKKILISDEAYLTKTTPLNRIKF